MSCLFRSAHGVENPVSKVGRSPEFCYVRCRTWWPSVHVSRTASHKGRLSHMWALFSFEPISTPQDDSRQCEHLPSQEFRPSCSDLTRFTVGLPVISRDLLSISHNLCERPDCLIRHVGSQNILLPKINAMAMVRVFLTFQEAWETPNPNKWSHFDVTISAQSRPKSRFSHEPSEFSLKTHRI